MQPKQRFFERKDGSTQPLAYGYGRVSHPSQFEKGSSLEDQEARISEYMKANAETVFKGVQYAGTFLEPLAQSAKTKAFRNRPKGKELYALLQPGDHLIVDKFDRLIRSAEDFCNTNRFFVEHGVRLHILNMAGMQFDSESAMGQMIALIMAAMAELENNMRGERVKDARARLRARKLHGGGKIPWFCDIEGQEHGKQCGAGGRLVFKPWAEKLFRRIEELYEKEGVGWWGMVDILWKEFKECGFRWQSYMKYRDLYDFWKGWHEMNCPDINEIRIVEVRENYRRKRQQQEKKRGT